MGDLNQRGDLYQRIADYVCRHRMFEPGQGVVVAVSGGSDSVALLHLLSRLQETYGLQLHVAHLHHGLRGEEADEDLRFVAELASSLGIPFSWRRVDVADRARRDRVGVEEAGRAARYEFLEETADRVGAQRVALGHTRDDQAETVLMRLLRGSGIDGLAGIPPVRGRIVRPLLVAGREELQEYCRQQGLGWRVDFTNMDPAFFRNRIRHELLPFLEERFSRTVRATLAETAEVLRPDVTWLRQQTEEALAAVARPRPGGLDIDAEALRALPPALGRRVIRAAVGQVKYRGRQLGARHVQAVLDMLDLGRDGEVHLPGGVVAVLQDYRLSVQRVAAGAGAGAAAGATGFRYGWQVPGEVEVPEAGLCLHGHVIPEETGVRCAIAGSGREPGWGTGGEQDRGSELAWRALLDYNKAGAQLLVRSWQPGDRFYPLGMEAAKKLQDFFVDAKVAREQRQRIPLVLSGDEIVWVVGYRIDHRFRVTPATRDILVLEAHPLARDAEKRGV
ncbi:MAG TPA: tRNA lysidine(34) synthetase TilS [Firmicutes bacterium]|nr:tRNA lysidine(34) synthetase TilS [Bacillota bacterium]